MADQEQQSSPERVKYTVHAASIKDDKGNKKRHGEVVELSPKLAQHYNGLGYLRPYIPEIGEDDQEVVPSAKRNSAPRSGEEPPTPRSNRTTQL